VETSQNNDVSNLSFNTPSNCYFPKKRNNLPKMDVEVVKKLYHQKTGKTTGDIETLYNFWV
jgi:hypothetical protein